MRERLAKTCLDRAAHLESLDAQIERVVEDEFAQGAVDASAKALLPEVHGQAVWVSTGTKTTRSSVAMASRMRGRQSSMSKPARCRCVCR